MTFARFVLKLLTQSLHTTYHDWCELERLHETEAILADKNWKLFSGCRENNARLHNNLLHAKALLAQYRQYPAFLNFMFECGQCNREIKESKPPESRINADRFGREDYSYQVCAECKLSVPPGAAS